MFLWLRLESGQRLQTGWLASRLEVDVGGWVHLTKLGGLGVRGCQIRGVIYITTQPAPGEAANISQ